MNHREEMFKLGLYMISMEKKMYSQVTEIGDKKTISP